MVTKNMIFSFKMIAAGILLSLFPVFATSQVNVIHLGDSKAISEKDGIFYALPRTVINISLVVNKIQKTKGPYAEFANKYLDINTMITDNSIEYELREVRISTTAEPDPEQIFFAALDKKSSKKDKFNDVYLSEAGFLLDATDVSKLKNPHVAGSDSYKESGITFTDILNPSYFERVDTIIRRVSVDTTTIEQKVFRKISGEKDTEQKAKDAADIIIELDEDRLDLISGVQDVGFGSNLEYMCNELDKMKAQYLALFKGLTTVTTTTLNYNFIPKQGEALQVGTLCKFSKIKGVMDKSAANGDQVTIDVESQGLTKTISIYLNSRNEKKKREHGFCYRIPDEAKITVKVGGQTSVEAVFSVNQLGIISSVPAGSSSSLRLHPATGSVKRVILK